MAQLKILFVDLKQYNCDAETIQIIPEILARHYRVVSLKKNPDGSLLVGMADSTDVFAYDELSKN